MWCRSVISGASVSGLMRRVNHTRGYDLPHAILLCDVFVSGDGELAPGNLNHRPAGAEQLTRPASGVK